MVKKRIAYLLVAATFFLFIYLQETDLNYRYFYFILVLPIISMVLGFITKYFIKVEFPQTSYTIKRMEETSLTFKLTNDFFLPISQLSLRFNPIRSGIELTKKQQDYFVPAKKQCDYHLSVTGIHCEKVDLTVKEIIFYDLLGLIKFKKRLWQKVEVYVAPRVLPVEGEMLKMNHDGADTSHNPLSGHNPYEIAYIRNHQSTDSQRQIHWKATARSGSLMSKVYSDTSAYTLTVCMENISGQALMETILKEGVASLLHFYHRHHFLIELPASMDIKAMGEEDFAPVYDWLTVTDFKEAAPIIKQLRTLQLEGHQLPLLLVAVDTIDDDLHSALEKHVPARTEVLLCFVNDTTTKTSDRFQKVNLNQLAVN